MAFSSHFRYCDERVAKRRSKRKCEHCRNWFTPEARGRPPRFCSASCRQRAYEQRRAERPKKDPALAALHADLSSLDFRTEKSKEGGRLLGLLAEHEVLKDDPETVKRAEAALKEWIEVERLEQHYDAGGRGRPRSKKRMT